MKFTAEDAEDCLTAQRRSVFLCVLRVLCGDFSLALRGDEARFDTALFVAADFLRTSVGGVASSDRQRYQLATLACGVQLLPMR